MSISLQNKMSIFYFYCSIFVSLFECVKSKIKSKSNKEMKEKKRYIYIVCDGKLAPLSFVV